MIEVKDIKKIVAHAVKRDQGIPDRRLLHPIREWLIVLGVATVLLVIVIIVAVLQFYKYQQISKQDIDVSVESLNYKRADVMAAIERYAAARAAFTEVMSQEVPVREQPIDVATSTTTAAASSTPAAANDVPSTTSSPEPAAASTTTGLPATTAATSTAPAPQSE